ncbi:heterokaryon incompatibility protein-domain-containing protein [Stachybotrys elegans]|uniref:Heterokaryon incompatibility protein-domain-containing protein n=1 Tax=Stachybotrys elegans TaxID=80388 RepID=A0A8K0SJ01_9HYPO|nr:heterokaryon incompatibility protein-domain-containing protein [Stachybotrys elegans]
MPKLSELCGACHKALYTERASLATPQAVYNYEPHHPTLHSLACAIKQECYVCRLVDQNVRNRGQQVVAKSPSKGSARTMYLLRAKGDLNLQLVVIFLGEDARIETKFRLFPTGEPKSERFFPPLQLDVDMSSPASLNMVEHWYRSCCSSHTLCNRQARQLREGWLPSRLLYIGSNGDACWRLIVVSQDLSDSAPYVTLSYRWGPNQSVKLLRSTLQDFRLGQQRILDLPQTFQDAIDVTRRLSIRYLWIDALCIVQDASEDKDYEIPQMRKIYSNAMCNLAASASDDPHGGLFRTRDKASVAPGLVAAPSGAVRSETHRIVDMTYRDRQILSGPLHGRGWVFQERFLSTRVIYFGQFQMFWECLSDVKCEGFPEGMPQSQSTKSLEPLWDMSRVNTPTRNQAMTIPALRLWNSLVREYSNCALTFPDDRLQAFAGIADLFREATGDEYLSGLWRSNLLHLLDWWVDQPRTRVSSKYRAPSWSWASLDGPIRPRFAVADYEFLVSISAIVPKNQGKLCLRLTGSLISLTKPHLLMRCTLYPDSSSIMLGKLQGIFLLPLQITYHGNLAGSMGRHEGLAEVSCLLLEPVLCTEPVVYRRVGHCVASDGGDISQLGLYIHENKLVRVQGTDVVEMTLI